MMDCNGYSDRTKFKMENGKWGDQMTEKYNSELYHFGIKGMRWGVRRFQKKDGSLTNAGKKRYSDETPAEQKKSKHRLNLEAKYREKGMSQKDAEMAAARRIKIEKVVAATAGITIAAATTYIITKRIQEQTDKIIEAGTSIQRITRTPDEDLTRPFYGAYKSTDKAKYKGILAKNHLNGDNVHQISLKADRDIKVASRKKAADTFAELYVNDSEFRQNFTRNNDVAKRMFIGGEVHEKIASRKMTDKELRTIGYDAYNKMLTAHDEASTSNAKKFYNKLKSLGYDAIEDINDQKYSGYDAKSPVIFFNVKDKLTVDKVSKMSTEQIASNFDKAMNDLITERSIKQYAELGAKVVTASTAGALGTMSINTVAINRYRVDHPNSGLTDDQILKKLKM